MGHSTGFFLSAMGQSEEFGKALWAMVQHLVMR
jgi:hypothetical protein